MTRGPKVSQCLLPSSWPGPVVPDDTVDDMDYSEPVYRSLGFAEPSELTQAVLEGAIPGLKKQKAFGDAASLQRACGREGGEGVAAPAVATAYGSRERHSRDRATSLRSRHGGCIWRTPAVLHSGAHCVWCSHVLFLDTPLPPHCRVSGI